MPALLEKIPVEGYVITLDALHTARAIWEALGADYLMTVKRNVPETRRILASIDWECDADGRIERRRIAARPLPRA